LLLALVQQAILRAGNTTLELGEAQYVENATPITAVFDGLGSDSTHAAAGTARDSQCIPHWSFGIADAEEAVKFVIRDSFKFDWIQCFYRGIVNRSRRKL
jgi:hypothetical protein